MNVFTGALAVMGGRALLARRDRVGAHVTPLEEARERLMRAKAFSNALDELEKYGSTFAAVAGAAAALR